VWHCQIKSVSHHSRFVCTSILEVILQVPFSYHDSMISNTGWLFCVLQHMNIKPNTIEKIDLNSFLIDVNYNNAIHCKGQSEEGVG
jgi:hypothetical protein